MFVRDLDYDIRMLEEKYNARMLAQGVLKEIRSRDGHIVKCSLKELAETVYQEIMAGLWFEYCDCEPVPDQLLGEVRAGK